MHILNIKKARDFNTIILFPANHSVAYLFIHSFILLFERLISSTHVLCSTFYMQLWFELFLPEAVKEAQTHVGSVMSCKRTCDPPPRVSQSRMEKQHVTPVHNLFT